AFLVEQDGPASAARLHALVDRVARAVRQAGEIAGSPGWEAAIERVTGADFTPDPAHDGNGFCAEAAFAWLAGDTAYIAAIGRAAVLLARDGRLDALHRLHVLAESWPPGVPFDAKLGFQVVTSVLAIDPARLLGDLHERAIALSSADRLALVSPAIAMPWL